MKKEVYIKKTLEKTRKKRSHVMLFFCFYYFGCQREYVSIAIVINVADQKKKKMSVLRACKYFLSLFYF